MNDALSKIENFLFDILGLVLPGFIFLSIFISPISLIDIQKISAQDLESSFILSELSTISKIIKTYWITDFKLLLMILFITSYLVGHFVKVFAIIIYELLTAIFDKTFNQIIYFIFTIIKKILYFLFNKIFNKELNQTGFGKWFKEFLYPVKNNLLKLFIFKPEDYFRDNESLKSNCINIINSKLNTQFPDKWYSLYKFSMVIANQEGIKSLSSNFLAKYNLYRSLAFIFLFSTAYYYLFFIASEKYIEADLNKITTLILLFSSLLWFTFHYKYKRYWTLCGNETLISLFYFLNKKKVNEN